MGAYDRLNIAEAFADLWTALEAVDDRRDRTALVDRARAALDRGASRLSAASPGLVAGTFWIEDVLSESSSSTIWRVRHRDLGARHALKAPRDERATDPIQSQFMLREARHHLGVRHPAVLPATMALRLHDGRPALLMDLVDGPSLAAVLDDRALDRDEAAALGRRLEDGLAAIHATGVVHLDLTPANILLPDGDLCRAQICDFGLSLPFGARRSDDDVAFAGTPGFAAPEQADPDWPASPSADRHALDALLARARAPDGRNSRRDGAPRPRPSEPAAAT